MPIPEPIFDSRSYREILNEALARIPVHNPEWTNYTAADPGTTLLEIFSFLVESVIYRANRIPDRNRRKFLRLLGEGVRAPSAARGMVVFSNPRGELNTVTLASDQELFAGKIPFRTTNALSVLPIEARVYYKQALDLARSPQVETLYRRLYASYAKEYDDLGFYETRLLEAPKPGARLPVIDLSVKENAGNQAESLANSEGNTVDGSLWLALLARPKEDPETARAIIANKVLTLGVVPDAGSEGSILPAGVELAERGGGLIFEVPNTRQDGLGGNKDLYQPLDASSAASLLLRPGVVELALPGAEFLNYWQDLDPAEAGVGDFPPELQESAVADRLITWIRIRPAPDRSGTASRGTRARFSWLGINAAEVVQRAYVPGERLPNGTGEPDQSATLAHTPVIPGSVALSVDGELWGVVDDIAAAAGEVLSRDAAIFAPNEAATRGKVYSIDYQTGEIRFGDGMHGARPPYGARIQASYAYGGGVEGMLGINAIKKASRLPTGIEVDNPLPTYGGDSGETLVEAERRIPAFLRHRDRLISVRDFEDILWRTPGVELGRVEVLPLFHPDQQGQMPAKGVVTVLVIPQADSLNPRAPEPDRLFLESVCAYLAPRRLLTTEIHVRGPVYRDIWVAVGIDVVTGREQAPVRDAVKAAIERFLSPLSGGFDGTGWPLNNAVDAAEIRTVAARVDGVSKVVELFLGDESGARSDVIAFADLKLPRLRAVSVSLGEAMSLDELRGVASGTQTNQSSTPRFPVPVIPESC